MGSGARVAVTAVVVGDDGLGTAGRVVVAHGQLHAVARDYVHIIVGPAYWSKVCSATVAQHAVGLVQVRHRTAVTGITRHDPAG